MDSPVSLHTVLADTELEKCYHHSSGTGDKALPDDGSASLEEQLYRIPKTDFHCHLNGSISSALLAHLERLTQGECGGSAEEPEDILFFNSAAKRQQNIFAGSPTSPSEGGKDTSPTTTAADRMNYCFSVFDNIYKLMTNLSFTRLAVQDMLLTSAAENVMAMEIRTSLRDGMTNTFLPRKSNSSTIHNDGGNRKDEDEEKRERSRPPLCVVSKQAYVEAVTATVEHLLGTKGGVVDLETGELTERDEDWEEQCCAIYGFLADQGKGEARPKAPNAEVPISSSSPSPRGEHKKAVLKAIIGEALRRMKTTLHVRLLLSVNRSAGPAAARETADIATLLQRRQVKDFYLWCTATRNEQAVQSNINNNNNNSSSRKKRSPARSVSARLRQTCWITGMDFSGNCYKGTFAEFEPIFAAVSSRAVFLSETSLGNDHDHTPFQREAPLSLGRTYHGGEKQDPVELAEMLASGPERWGHLVFTDAANLRHILARHDPIELCITSNLLTGGHAHVREHHLTTILEAWQGICHAAAGSDSEQAMEKRSGSCTSSPLMDLLNNDAVYAESARQRRERRVRRYRPHYRDAVSSTDHTEATATVAAVGIPNISFHTDDRGVFGTTVAHELLLASQHPLVVSHAGESARGSGASAIVSGMRALERLSLLGMFDLHWAVMLLALSVEAPSHARGQEEGEEEEAKKAVQTALSAMEPALASCDAFLAWLCDLASSSSFPALCAELSDVEWRWLTRCFDEAT